MKKNVSWSLLSSTMIAIAVLSLIACSNDADEPSLTGQKFYESHHTFYEGKTYYYCVDFISDRQYTFYETDENFIQKTRDSKIGSYIYDSKSGNIKFDRTIHTISSLDNYLFFISGTITGQTLSITASSHSYLTGNEFEEHLIFHKRQ